MPQQYTLNLTINATDLQTISAAGENIVVAKLIDGSSPSVAWLCFTPMQSTTVQWTEQYGIYASQTQTLEGGIIITQSSTTPYPASPGICYQLSPNGVFSSSPTYGYLTIPAGSYSALNQVSAYAAMTFGLTQAAIISGTNVQASSVSAELLPSNQQAIFTPSTTVWVWLQSSITAGTVITNLFNSSAVAMAVSQPAVVSFTGGVTTQSLQYSSSLGKFVPA